MKKKIKTPEDFKKALQAIKRTRPVAAAVNKQKKLRRKNITVKYLKSQEPELWEEIEESVTNDMALQRSILNNNKNRTYQQVGLIPIEYVSAVAHNAAFRAVSEHLKKTRKMKVLSCHTCAIKITRPIATLDLGTHKEPGSVHFCSLKHMFEFLFTKMINSEEKAIIERMHEAMFKTGRKIA